MIGLGPRPPPVIGSRPRSSPRRLAAGRGNTSAGRRRSQALYRHRRPAGVDAAPAIVPSSRRIQWVRLSGMQRSDTQSALWRKPCTTSSFSSSAPIPASWMASICSLLKPAWRRYRIVSASSGQTFLKASPGRPGGTAE